MCIMLFSMTTPSMAAEAQMDENGEVVYYEMMDNLVQPRWSYAATASAALSIQGGTATMSYDCTGITGKCTKIVANAYLQKMDRWIYNDLIQQAILHTVHMVAGKITIHPVQEVIHTV